jgi:hypothetical protein
MMSDPPYQQLSRVLRATAAAIASSPQPVKRPPFDWDAFAVDLTEYVDSLSPEQRADFEAGVARDHAALMRRWAARG